MSSGKVCQLLKGSLSLLEDGELHICSHVEVVFCVVRILWAVCYRAGCELAAGVMVEIISPHGEVARE